MLFVACSSVFVVCCLSIVVSLLLFVVRGVLSVVECRFFLCCRLFVVEYWLLFDAVSLFVVRCFVTSVGVVCRLF